MEKQLLKSVNKQSLVKSFFMGRARSLKYALKGAYLLLSTEHSIMMQFSIGLIFIFMGMWFGISKIEWMFQLFAIGMVLGIEAINTGIEKLADFIHPDYHKKIGFIKDISAGASTFAVIVALIIGIMIYYPYFQQ